MKHIALLLAILGLGLAPAAYAADKPAAAPVEEKVCKDAEGKEMPCPEEKAEEKKDG